MLSQKVLSFNKISYESKGEKFERVQKKKNAKVLHFCRINILGSDGLSIFYCSVSSLAKIKFYNIDRYL